MELAEFKRLAKEALGVSLHAGSLEEAVREMSGFRKDDGGVAVTRPLASAPATLDDGTRTVECVIASEAPYVRYDWNDKCFYEEILVVRGARLGEIRGGSLPLLDSHDYWAGTKALLGSTRDIRVEGSTLVGLRQFSTIPEAERVFTLIREGHLPTQSIGYRIFGQVALEPGAEGEVLGETVRNGSALRQVYVTDWLPVEDSVVVFPADPSCGVRSRENVKKDFETPNKEGTKSMENEDQKKTPQIDVNAEREAATKAERRRVGEISGLCRSFGLDAEPYIESGATIEEVRKAVLDELAKRDAAQAPKGVVGKVTVVREAVEKVSDAIRDGLVMGAGMSVAKPAEGAEDFCGAKVSQVCRALLESRGEKVGYAESTASLVTRAIATGDLPKVLGGTGEKLLLKSFDEADEPYSLWVDASGILPNWREVPAERLTGRVDLLEVQEGQESEYAYFGETEDKVKLGEFARKIALTNRAVDNDDFGQFLRRIQDAGAAARRLEASMSYDILVNNPTMGDGVALFHASHGNLATAAGAPSEATVQAAVVAMATQKDVDGKTPVVIRPSYIVAPMAISMVIEKLLNTTVWDDANAASSRKNTLYGALQPVYDARLDAAFASAGTWPWFVIGPKGWGVKLYKLAGQTSPRITRDEDHDTRSVKFNISYALVAHAESWQGMYKNAGASK